MKRKSRFCYIVLIIAIIIISFKLIVEISSNKSTDEHYWNQWALDNDGTFVFSRIDETNIYTNTYNSRKGIDIGYKAGILLMDPRRSITIAVIDTGVQFEHEAFNNAIWSNEREVPDDEIDNDNNGYIDDVYGWNFYDDNNDISEDASQIDHGTHIVGTLCAYGDDSLVKGVVGGFDINVMCLKILDENGDGDIEDLKEAILYAEDNGADICCLSIETEHDAELEAYLKKSNMLFVVSAGNDGKNIDNEPVYPASYESSNIVVVANVSCDGQLCETSNFGVKTVDISAPGTDIVSTVPSNGYAYKTGTSMAVPFVAGVIALTYCNSDTIDLVTAKDIVFQSVKRVESLENITITGGMPDIFNALTYLNNYTYLEGK